MLTATAAAELAPVADRAMRHHLRDSRAFRATIAIGKLLMNPGRGDAWVSALTQLIRMARGTCRTNFLSCRNI